MCSLHQDPYDERGPLQELQQKVVCAQIILTKHLVTQSREVDVHAALVRRLGRWLSHVNSTAAAKSVAKLIAVQGRRLP